LDIEGEPFGVMVMFPDEVEAERLLFDDMAVVKVPEDGQPRISSW
jgi:hypothetical protein